MARKRVLKDPPFDSLPTNGLLCDECNQPQRISPSGAICPNGHGGVDGHEETIDEGFDAEFKEKKKKIAETSAQLAKELDASQPTVWDNANQAEEDPLDPEFERIVTKIFVDHPLEEYERLETALRIGEKRSDRGTVNKALDEAEANARTAHRLWMTAKVEHQRWELENQVLFGAMRAEATKTLQREKDQKLRNKQITDADVEATCALLFPDEYKHQEVKRRKVEAMVKSMENLCECWMSRCRSLQAMLGKQR